MDEKSRYREIEKIKEALQNPKLRINEINNLEAYLKSLEAEK